MMITMMNELYKKHKVLCIVFYLLFVFTLGMAWATSINYLRDHVPTVVYSWLEESKYEGIPQLVRGQDRPGVQDREQQP